MSRKADGSFELIDTDEQLPIPPKLWAKLSRLISAGKAEQAEKLLDKLLREVDDDRDTENQID